MTNRVIGSTDVYSRRHIDRELDRLDRLRVHDKAKIKELQRQLADLLAWKANLQRVGRALPEVDL